MTWESAHSGVARRVTIVGAGITGLSAAFRLRQQLGNGVDITVLEASATAGGVIRSGVLENSIIEQGPESFTTMKPAMLDLCNQLGLKDHLLNTSQSNAQTLVARGRSLEALPEGFIMFAPVNMWSLAFSPLFTMFGKMRMLMDLVLPRSSKFDESISDFVRRRLGDEALDRVAEPLLSGIFGAPAETLSARSTIPQMVSLEDKYGSIIKGLWTQSKSRGKAHQSGANYSAMVTLDEGLDVIIKKLISKLPEGSIKINRQVSEIRRMGDCWQTRLSTGEVYNSDGVIVACPAIAAATVLTALDSQLSDLLSRIEYNSAAIYNFLFDKHSVMQALNGFGFVVPQKERKLIKACSFSSVKFPVRTPGDLTLLRVFTTMESREQCMAREADVLLELKEYLDISGQPIARTVRHHHPAIPRYSIGHRHLVSQIEEAVSGIPGLALAGNAYHGMGLPDCVASANAAADRIISAWACDNLPSELGDLLHQARRL